MSYLLFDEKNNFTKVLFGKTDAELLKERGISNDTESSRDSSNEVDHARNEFLLKVLEALLEPVNSPAIPQYTDFPPSPQVKCACTPSSSPPMNTFVPPRTYPLQRQTAATNLPSLMTIAPRRSPSPPPLMSIAVPTPFASQKQMIPPLLPHYQPQYSCRPVPLMAMSIPPPYLCYY